MVYNGQKGQTKNLFSLWNYGDKCEKRCKTLDWFVCVCIFEKWLNGKPDIIVKLHFRLSCIISNNYLQKTHGTKLITTINDYCIGLYMLPVVKQLYCYLTSKGSYCRGQQWWKNTILTIQEYFWSTFKCGGFHQFVEKYDWLHIIKRRPKPMCLK